MRRYCTAAELSDFEFHVTVIGKLRPLKLYLMLTKFPLFHIGFDADLK